MVNSNLGSLQASCNRADNWAADRCARACCNVYAPPPSKPPEAPRPPPTPLRAYIYVQDTDTPRSKDLCVKPFLGHLVQDVNLVPHDCYDALAVAIDRDSTTVRNDEIMLLHST